jgi:Zn-dependent peptidase ImmA (M78 family)
LAVRTEADNNLRFVFRKARKDARRFEAARFLGDFLMASPDDRWLPLTDTKTARQKMQRAFAAEFLMPIEELVGFMGNDFSNERMESAAEEFQVSSLAVRSHLANSNHIPAF